MRTAHLVVPGVDAGDGVRKAPRGLLGAHHHSAGAANARAVVRVASLAVQERRVDAHDADVRRSQLLGDALDVFGHNPGVGNLGAHRVYPPARGPADMRFDRVAPVRRRVGCRDPSERVTRRPIEVPVFQRLAELTPLVLLVGGLRGVHRTPVAHDPDAASQVRDRLPHRFLVLRFILDDHRRPPSEVRGTRDTIPQISPLYLRDAYIGSPDYERKTPDEPEMSRSFVKAFLRAARFPKFTNEVQHLIRVLPWENAMSRSPLKTSRPGVNRAKQGQNGARVHPLPVVPRRREPRILSLVL